MLRLLSLFVVLGACVCQTEVSLQSYSHQQIAAIACNNELQPAVITGIIGKIQSLNFPSRPDDDIYCEYLLEPNSGTAQSGLVVTVKEFYTEPDFDVLTIYEGSSPTPFNEVATWSGSKAPDTSVEIANTSSVLITFENDCWTTYEDGFELVFYSMDIGGDAQDVAEDACDGSEAVLVVDDDNPVVFLESEHFPNTYPMRDRTCTWVIKAACDEYGNSHNLTITLLEFQLANDDDDFVEIFRDRGPNADLLETLTDRHDPMSFSLDVEYGTMEMRFTTDDDYAYDKGFRIAVSYSDSEVLETLLS